MHFFVVILIIFLVWRAFKALAILAYNHERNQNIWKLMFLAFIGALLRRLIQGPKDRPQGNAPATPRSPVPPFNPGDWEDIFDKAVQQIEARERTRERVG